MAIKTLTASILSPTLPSDIDKQVFSCLGPYELRNCLYVSKIWKQVANNEDLWKPFYRNIACFGEEWWERKFGKIDYQPPLPRNIFQILERPCRIIPGKKVKETNILCLIVKVVDGKPLTFKHFVELVKTPKEGHALQAREIDLGDYEDVPVSENYWVLKLRTVAPNSRNKPFPDQETFVREIAIKVQIPYEIPNLLEEAIPNLAEYVELGTSQGNATYGRTTTKVNGKWQLVVGGLSSGGFRVDVCGYGGDGVSILRKS